MAPAGGSRKDSGRSPVGSLLGVRETGGRALGPCVLHPQGSERWFALLFVQFV